MFKKSLFPKGKWSGFTLIELLVVIVIIGILVSIAFAVYSSAQVKARDIKRKGDLDAVKKALENIHFDCKTGYPRATYNINNAGRYVNLQSYLKELGYMNNPPQDPQFIDINGTYKYETTYITNETDVADNCPRGTGNATGISRPDYYVRATLENSNDPNIQESKSKCPSVPNTTHYYVCSN